MDKKNVKKRIKELEALLEKHNDLYFNQDSPEITDYEFDQLSLELRALEKEHPELADADSPTKRVGGRAKRTASWSATESLCSPYRMYFQEKMLTNL